MLTSLLPPSAFSVDVPVVGQPGVGADERILSEGSDSAGNLRNMEVEVKVEREGDQLEQMEVGDMDSKTDTEVEVDAEVDDDAEVEDDAEVKEDQLG